MGETVKKRAWGWIGFGVVVALLIGAASITVFMQATHRHGPAGVAGVTESLWTCSMHPFILLEEPGDCPVCGMTLIPKAKETVATAAPSGERAIAYWRAPMNPAEVYEAPGKSAMGMDLVPVYEDELLGGVVIRINPVMEQNMGVRVKKAVQAPLARTLSTWGHVAYDETRTYRVSPRFSGWLHTIKANFEGQVVKKGDPLFTVYSPELIAAQEEYLNARRRHGGSGQSANDRILAAAKRKLLNYGMDSTEIRRAEKLEKALDTVTVTSPYTGVVVSKSAVEGGYFKSGSTLYTVSDLSRVWVEAHIYEYEVGRVRKGQKASMTLSFGPKKTLTGKVAYVYPFMEGRTRDITVRLEFENNDGFLKPDMYANVSIETNAGSTGVVIPAEAVLHSENRETVFVRTAKGQYTPRAVVTGMPLNGGRIQILEGIAPGDQVVTSGQFLMDSESQLKEAVAKMMDINNPEPPREAPAPEADDFFDDM